MKLWKGNLGAAQNKKERTKEYLIRRRKRSKQHKGYIKFSNLELEMSSGSKIVGVFSDVSSPTVQTQRSQTTGCKQSCEFAKVEGVGFVYSGEAKMTDGGT